MYLIGSSQRDITPNWQNSQNPTYLWGFAPGTRPGELQDNYFSLDDLEPETLLCQATCISDTKQKQLFVTFDLGSLSEDITSQIIQWISGKFSIPQENICIHVTHNHAAPAVTDFLDMKISQDIYKKCIIQAGVDACIDAIENTSQTELYHYTGTSAIWKHRRAGSDLHDNTLNVLVGTVQGEVKHILVNTACHPVIVRDTVSADFVGDFRSYIRKVYPGVAVLFFQGFAATSNPRIDSTPENTTNICTQIWNQLGDEVQQLISTEGKKISWPLASKKTKITLPFTKFPDAMNDIDIYSLWSQFYNTDDKVEQMMNQGFPTILQRQSIGDFLILASSHEPSGNLSKILRREFPHIWMTLWYSGSMGWYLVDSDDQTEEKGFPYESCMSHMWNGNPGILAPWWKDMYIGAIRELMQT